MKIKVPATTANVGPGFDTLGIALNLFNSYELGQKEENQEANLATISFQRYFEFLGKRMPGFQVNICETNIPRSRGLGSSASLIVAGLSLANEWNKRAISDAELLNMATEIEGHPDNVAPAIFGGLVISSARDGHVYYSRFDLDEDLNFYVFIPDYSLSTEEARKLLPDQVTRQEAVENISNTSMLIAKLIQRDYEDLDIFFKDNLHEPYRKKLIRDYDEIKGLFNCPKVLGAYLSGAGPSMMVIGKDDSFLENLSFDFQGEIVELQVHNSGYIIEH